MVVKKNISCQIVNTESNVLVNLIFSLGKILEYICEHMKVTGNTQQGFTRGLSDKMHEFLNYCKVDFIHVELSRVSNTIFPHQN